MKEEKQFLFKVMRNAFILAGLYFVSVFAVGDLSYAVCKPVLVFFLGYILTELANRYGLNMKNIPTKKGATLIF